MTLSAQIGYMCHSSITYRAGDNQTMKQYTKPNKIANTLRHGLCGDDPLATVMLPQRSLASQSIGKYMY